MSESGTLDVKASTDEVNRENAEDVSGTSVNEVSNQATSEEMSLVENSGGEHEIVGDPSESGTTEESRSPVMEDSKDNVILDHGPSSPSKVEIKYQPFKANLSKMNYSEKILAGFYHMFDKSILVDYKIKLEDDAIISCHKSILCANSEYFYAFFTGNFDDRVSSEADFQMFDPECVRKVIDYCYTGDICCDWEKIEDLLDVVCYLGIPELLEKIDEFVSWKVTPENAIHWFEETCVRELPETRNALFTNLLSSFYSTQVFKGVSLTEIFDRLTDDHLKLREEIVFLAAMSWWNCVDNRKLDPHGTVFDCIRFKFLSKSLDQFKEAFNRFDDLLPLNLKKHFGLLSDNDTDSNKSGNPSKISTMLSDECLETKSADDGMNEDVNEKIEVIQRQLHYIKDIILIETTVHNPNEDDKNDKKCLYFVSDKYKFPVFVVNFPESVYDQTMCVTPKGIIFTGGRYDKSADEADNITDNSFLYDIYDHDIYKLPDMINERCGHICVMVGSKMFAIGGDCYEEDIQTWKAPVLCLDTYNMNWTSHSMIPVEMLILSTAVIDKSIYILGRTRPKHDGLLHEEDVVMFFYRYDTEHHNWQNLSLPTKSFMYSPCLYASGNKVYLANMHRQMHRIYCLVYDAELDAWQLIDKVSGLNYVCNFKSFVLHGKLMACLDYFEFVNDFTYGCFDMDLKTWFGVTDIFPSNVRKSWSGFNDFPFHQPYLCGEKGNKLYHASLVLTPEDERIIELEKRLS